MIVGVTGASGFIGSHLMQAAKHNSIPFIGLSRSKDNNNLSIVKNHLARRAMGLDW